MTTHNLYITDGTYTVNLATDNNKLVEYTPESPNLSVVDFTPEALRDGGERPLVTRRNLTEKAEVIFIQTSRTLALTAIRNLELMFMLAERFQNRGYGDKVWLKIQPGGSGTVWRSEILSGKVNYDKSALGYGWNESALRVDITWTRRYYWEANTESQLSLYHPSTPSSPGTAPVEVSNRCDGTASGTARYNWLGMSVTAAVVPTDGGSNLGSLNSSSGSIPAPVRLEVTNTFDDAAKLRRLYVAERQHAIESNTFDHTFEAEDASIHVAGSVIADGDSSGGSYLELPLTATETKLLTWTLTTANLNQAAGRYHRIMSRLVGAIPSGAKLRMKVAFSTTVVVWEGPQVALGTANFLQDLGMVQLPPYLVGAGDIYPLGLQVWGKVASGTANLGMDYFYLMPMDGWAFYEPRTFGLQYNARLVDEGNERCHYTDSWTTAGKTGHYVKQGDPLLVWPGKQTEFYFLQDGDSGLCDITRTLTVKMYFRPRILTL